MRYAFTFDASACTGCKACQVACKDKNALPTGMLWRRVYEVSGGGWERRGAAWTNTVFAYNVSVACNHCADPACAKACPTGACSVRDDGIVWIDSGKCAGCEYCSWACPYSAPKYSRELGCMTKCDCCRDLVDEGHSPACVAACPMRALDFRVVDDHGLPLPSGAHALWQTPASAHPYPLPAYSRTQPRVAMKPHAAMGNALPKSLANREEVRPPKPRPARTVHGLHVEDLPLVLFTLLGQAGAGAAVIAAIIGWMTRPLLLTIGGLAALAALASLLHLGNVSQAWRTPSQARRSPLSREIVALAVFAAAWLLTWFAPSAGRVPLAVSGLALVYAMSEVYAIDGVPGWNCRRTRRAFACSASVLGIAALAVTAAVVPGWLSAPAAAAVFGDQVVRRWRFYAAVHQRAL